MTVDKNGLATVVWRRNNGTNNIVQSSTSLNGAAWSTPVDLSATGANATAPQVTVAPNGLATAVWVRNNGTVDIVQSSTSLSGAAWSTPVDLSATGQNAQNPQVTVDKNGLATAVWLRYNAGKTIVQSSTSLSGAAWSTPVNLSAVGQSAQNPQVIADKNGLAIAIWTRSNGTNTIVQSSTSLSGAAWSTPVDLSATGRNGVSPQVTVDSNGLATAVWIRNNGTNDIVQSSTSLSGAAWSTPVDLSATGQSAFLPQVTVDSNGLTIAIWYRSNGTNNIVQSSTSLSGAAWSTPVDLSATGQSAIGVSVTVDKNGLARAVWTRSNGTNTIVQSSARTPEQTTPTITTPPTAGSISYGTALSGATLTGGAASVPGTFTFTSPSTTPATGTSNVSITFTPSDTINYTTTTTTIPITVSAATPTPTPTPEQPLVNTGTSIIGLGMMAGGAMLMALLGAVIILVTRGRARRR